MDTMENAQQQGWVDGVHYLLIQRHAYDPDELVGKFESEDDARCEYNELDEVSHGYAIILSPRGDMCLP